MSVVLTGHCPQASAGGPFKLLDLRSFAGAFAALATIVLLNLGCMVETVATESETQPAKPTSDFEEISLEQLINIRVMSVSKKEAGLDQSPAAIAVITQGDIRRSGLTSIPELLRLVPGMDVADRKSVV